MELDGFDFSSALPRRLGDPMHAIHYGSARGQDYRERHICFYYQCHVLEHGAPSSRLIVAKPDLVKLSDLTQRNLLPRQVARELHETVHIPGQDSTTRRLKEVLFSHS